MKTTNTLVEGQRLQQRPVNSVQRFWNRVWRNRILYLMILPAIVAMFIFHYIPIYGIQIAFKDYRPVRGFDDSPWAGLKHFINFVKYPYFWDIMWNSLWINICSLLFFPVPVIFALFLNEMRFTKTKKVCQTITYAPHFVSTVIVCTMISMFCSTDGLFNILGALLGQEKATNLLYDPENFAWIQAISGLWQGLGWGTIIYTAALAGVSPELIEASKIDGANRWQVILHVNIPCILPTVITMLILRTGTLLSTGFEKVYLLQNNLNINAATTISTYVYEMGLINQQYSASTAINLFQNLIEIVLILLVNQVSKKVTETSLW